MNGLEAVRAEGAIQELSGNPVTLERTGHRWLALTAIGSRSIGAHGRTKYEALAKLEAELRKGVDEPESHTCANCWNEIDPMYRLCKSCADDAIDWQRVWA